MISRSKLQILARRARAVMFATPCFAMLGAMALPAHAATHTEPPWHIESFCHRGVPAARRCLIRARQGIIVFQLAELASAPGIQWHDGLAVLTTGKDERSRQLRFFAPPQKLSTAFNHVRAYDIGQQLVAVYANNAVHVRAMFADAHDLALLALPSNVSTDTLRLRFEGRSLHASWQDSKGHVQEQTVTAKN
jgi:hypothetical protein